MKLESVKVTLNALESSLKRREARAKKQGRNDEALAYMIAASEVAMVRANLLLLGVEEDKAENARMERKRIEAEIAGVEAVEAAMDLRLDPKVE